jgi:hypothetical protein
MRVRGQGFKAKDARTRGGWAGAKAFDTLHSDTSLRIFVAGSAVVVRPKAFPLGRQGESPNLATLLVLWSDVLLIARFVPFENLNFIQGQRFLAVLVNTLLQSAQRLNAEFDLGHRVSEIPAWRSVSL